MFDLISCNVAIGGDSRAVVNKPYCTVAEVLLLQSIHGQDAVTNIKVYDTFDSDDAKERDRLGHFYGDEKVVGLFNQFGELPKVLADSRIPNEILDPVWLNEKSRAPKKPVKKIATKRRARTAKGHFVKDDPDTPENEAYVEG